MVKIAIATLLTDKGCLIWPILFVNIPTLATTLRGVLTVNDLDFDSDFSRLVFEFCLEIEIGPAFQESTEFVDTGQIFHLDDTTLIPDGFL